MKAAGTCCGAEAAATEAARARWRPWYLRSSKPRAVGGDTRDVYRSTEAAKILTSPRSGIAEMMSQSTASASCFARVMVISEAHYFDPRSTMQGLSTHLAFV
jgi:hypothetical protein